MTTSGKMIMNQEKERGLSEGVGMEGRGLVGWLVYIHAKSLTLSVSLPTHNIYVHDQSDGLCKQLEHICMLVYICPSNVIPIKIH